MWIFKRIKKLYEYLKIYSNIFILVKFFVWFTLYLHFCNPNTRAKQAERTANTDTNAIIPMAKGFFFVFWIIFLSSVSVIVSVDVSEVLSSALSKWKDVLIVLDLNIGRYNHS